MPPTRDAAPDADRIQLSEAARILNRSADTVRRWGDSGYLRMWRVGPSRLREFSRADVERRLAEHETQVVPHQRPDNDEPATATAT